MSPSPHHRPTHGCGTDGDARAIHPAQAYCGPARGGADPLIQSGRPDLNRGPHRPERCALPGCATPREERIVAEGGGAARRGCPTPALLWPAAGLKAMRMRRIRLLMVVVVAALLALPATAGAYLPPGFVGLSPQNGLGHKDFELMREAGVDSVRLPFFWFGVESKSPLVVKP